jgi:hypothetical protein
MIEAAITGVIALVAGAAALTNRLHGRINSLDNRIDRLELNVATTYVTKDDHDSAMEKLESHMIRIEGKLDTFIQRYPRS